MNSKFNFVARRNCRLDIKQNFVSVQIGGISVQIDKREWFLVNKIFDDQNKSGFFSAHCFNKKREY